MEKLFEKYRKLLVMIDNEFERNIKVHGKKIKCAKGCFKCCFQKFRITPLDAIIIAAHISKIEIEKRELLLHKAGRYLETGEHLIKACPALDKQGACMIYEARPVVCRRFGPPMYDYKNPGRISSCDLNFAEGEEITDDHLIEEQTKIGKLWDEIKSVVYEKNKDNKSYTIPEAIKNYSKILSEFQNAGD